MAAWASSGVLPKAEEHGQKGTGAARDAGDNSNDIRFYEVGIDCSSFSKFVRLYL